MRIAIVSGLAALVLAAPLARADVGPPDPARRSCSGQPEGSVCELNGKRGTCHGPHPSRLYCNLKKPPLEPDDSVTASGSGSSGSSTGTGTGTGSGTTAADSAASTGSAAEAKSESATSPGHKRGCSVAEPGSASLIALALATLTLRRRRARLTS